MSKHEGKDKFPQLVGHYTYGSSITNKTRRQEYQDKYTCVPNCDNRNGGPPYFTIINMILCWSAFIIYNLNPPEGTTAARALMDSPFIYKPDIARTEPWRYFTYSFLHADWSHIISNSIIFCLVCPMLELAHDSFRPVLIYVVGVCLGSMLSGIVAPGVYLVGMSGGDYALVLAHIANIIVNGDIMDSKTLILRLAILAPMVGAAIWDTYNAAVRWSGAIFGEAAASRGGVSYAAHVAGAMTGLLFGAFMLRNYEVEKWETWFKVICLTIFALITAALIVLTAMDIAI